jgi:hypothetical protein
MKLSAHVVACLFGVGLVTGPAATLHAIAVESNVDFAAHVEHRGLVIDQMSGAPGVVLAPAGSFAFSGGPRFLLQRNGTTLAALWFPDPGHMIVRQSADPRSPLIGEVNAAWQQGAISLMIKPAEGPAYQTGVFGRDDGRLSSAALSWDATTVLDQRGTYRAELRDANGAPAGWLRVRISPYQGARRIYDGVVPASLNGPLATAAVAVLNSDVRYVRNRAQNVYLGN